MSMTIMCPLMKLIRVNSRHRQKSYVSRSQSGKLVKSESTSSDSPPQSSEKSKKIFTYSKHLKYLGIFAGVLVVVVVVATAAVLSLKNEADKPPHGRPTENPHTAIPSVIPRTTTKPGNRNDTLIPAGPGLIIEKDKWGGRASLNWTTSLILEHPTNFVIIMHTVTPQCHTFDECSTRVRSMQSQHVGTGASPDIRYNFVVGGDGNAYVGRGWDMKNAGQSDAIGISFIGDYVYDYLTPEMIDITKKLINIGVEKGKLAKDYKLVAHNQTYATISPGPHVYEVIKNWPHFDPTRYI
ncbi:peptidoglycan-recognition protein SC1a/b-like isoform X3 [Zophobas morio]|uniref:peptidoglycan-recognition protein SC1a/b-like isoform X3 n=1 Tax=Zophobas morio TaxID=2755281 RepID=UPI003082CF61